MKPATIFVLFFALSIQVGRIYSRIKSFQVAYSAIPDKYFGAWEVEKSENFDEYLSAKGVGWFVRKVIQMATITKIFDRKSDGTWDFN